MLTKINIALLTALLFTSSVFGQDIHDQVKTLKKEIILINLLNGLYLTPAQKNNLKILIAEAENSRQLFKSNMKDIDAGSISVLNKLKQSLQKENNQDKNLKKQINQNKVKAHQAQRRLGKALQGIENKVAAMLNENQLIIIETFKPCLIPHASGRVGQDSGKGGIHLLERFRNMSNIDRDRMQPMFEEKYLDQYQRHHGRLNTEEKALLLQEFRQVLLSAGSLSDEQFMLEKQTLAENLQIPEQPGKRPAHNQTGRLGRFLLDPVMIPQLHTN
ncbi:hypothetical protein KAR48_01655 [bacterium]|nr:hypothetical protein [bacterium]